jgi:hypothetical protein
MTSVITNYGHCDREYEVTIDMVQDGKRYCAEATFHEKGTTWRTPFVTDPSAISDFVNDTAEYILTNDFNYLDANGKRQWYAYKVDANAPTLRR